MGFRTCVIGGYNKNDVLDYIDELKAEIKELKENQAVRMNTIATTSKDGIITVYDETQNRIRELEEENERLQRELEMLRISRHGYEEEYDVIKKILLDAKLDTSVVIAKAEEKSRQMLAEMEEYIKEQHSGVFEKLKEELEHDRTELGKSNDRLQMQLESLEKVNADLSELKTNMHEMLQAVPKRRFGKKRRRRNRMKKGKSKK